MNNSELALCPVKTRYWHEKTYEPTKWMANYDYGDNRQYYTGITLAIVECNDRIAIGVAKCSRHDVFNKKMARLIARGRAIKALEKEMLYLCSTSQLVSTGWIVNCLKMLLPVDVVENII